MTSYLEEAIRKEGIGIFVDRENYKAVFKEKLKSLSQDKASVLLFYGEGGIGKTALLKELKKQIDSFYGDVAYAYIDFDNENLMFQEKALFKVRKDLGKKGLKFPLFDTAYLYYWDMAHPESPLRNDFNELVEWAEIPLAVVGLAHVGQLIRKSGVSKHVNKKLRAYVREGMPFIERLKSEEEGTRKMLDHLPLIMGADLHDHPKNKGKKVVLFFDTYEKLKNDGWIRDLHEHLKNSLFVIGGRERLSWSDTDDINEGKMNELDERDAKNYLEKRGVEDEKDRDIIYRNISGHPFGLGLSAELYRIKKESGDKITDEDFKGNNKNYNKLADRFLAHLDKNERHAIKLLSLYDWWNEEIFMELSQEFQLNLDRIDFGQLVQRSFVEEIEDGRYTMHDLMRTAIVSAIPDSEILEKHIQSAYKVIKKHFLELARYDEIKEIDEVKAEAAVDFVKYVLKSGWTEEEVEKCFELARGISDRAFYDEAQDIYNMLLGSSLPEEEKGNAYREIGAISRLIGDYNKALEYDKKALRIYLKIYGTEEHTEIARSYNNIGRVYHKKGDYDKALEYYKKALGIGQNIYGTEEHTEIARSYNNIGRVYHKKGDYDKALEYYKKALGIGQNIYRTEEHPDIARSYNNIGRVYYKKGDYDKALEYYKKALGIDQNIYGTEEHPDIARSYNNIGGVYSSRGDYDRALEYYEKALNIDLKIYGTEEHPDVATDYSNIGGVYDSRGDYDKALEYYQKALNIGLKIYGTEEHPNIAIRYSNIGLAYSNKGDYDRALEYYEKALNIAIRLLGKEHPSTIIVAENMLYVCEKTENTECIEKCREIIGEEESEIDMVIEWISESLTSGVAEGEIVKELADAGLSEDEAKEIVEAVKQNISEEEKTDEEKIIDLIADRLVSGATVDKVVQELADAGLPEDEAREIVEAVKQALDK